MARALLTLAFSRTAHLTTAAKFAKKFTSIVSRIVGSAVRKSPSYFALVGQ